MIIKGREILLVLSMIVINWSYLSYNQSVYQTLSIVKPKCTYYKSLQDLNSTPLAYTKEIKQTKLGIPPGLVIS